MDLNINSSFEEIKEYKHKLEQEYEKCLNNTRKLNNVLFERIEKGPLYSVSTEKAEKLKSLLNKLSKLINEKLELSESIKSKHLDLKRLYYESKNEIGRNLEAKPIPNEEIQREYLEAQAERDKALGLVKVLLATLKSSRMQSEENFHKLKYSADLMFHIMYKAEDNFITKD